MPRCYMVKKKGASRHYTEPSDDSSSEAYVAPPTNRPQDEYRVHTESQQADAAAEYQELRSTPLSERSAADTEAALELLSLAAGVQPLPPAVGVQLLPAAEVLPLPQTAVLAVLQPPEPTVPVFTYTLQPTTIFFVSDDQPEPIYQAVQTVPLPQVEYTPMENQQLVRYGTHTASLLPPPPLRYHPVQQPLHPIAPVIEQPINYQTPEDQQRSKLTTVTIEEVTDTEPVPQSIQVSVIEPVPQQYQVPISKRVPQQYPVPDTEPVPQPQGTGTEDLMETANIEAAPNQPETQATDTAAKTKKGTPSEAKKDKRGKHNCTECGKRYATSSNLSRHKQIHRSLESNLAKKCGKCGKAYVSMPALAMHVLTHRLIHVCGFCGKQFSRPWLLNGHVRSHTGEKPYNCGFCGKAFADRSNLRAHLQTHSSDKKFECNRCKKSFGLKSYLNKHQEAACTRADEDGAAA